MQSNHDNALVSIIMPLFNAESYVVDALTSVLSVRQIPLEVIVVNDGSTDRSLQKLHSIKDDRIQIVNNAGKGIADALNTGLAKARGSIIVRCDADDIYPIDRVERQVNWLNRHPEFGAVCGSYAAINPKGQRIITFECGTNSEDITAELQAGTTRTHLCTFAIRADVLRAVGGFRPYFITGEDIDMQLRLGDKTKVWYLPGVHYYYRVHKKSITHTKSSTEREFFDQVAREFQQQRQTVGIDALDQGCPPPIPPEHKKPPMSAAEHIQGFLLGEAWRNHRNGQPLKAIANGMRSALTLPNNLSVWRSVFSLAAKSVLADSR
ncbi:MAG TPA: glycosyltransferase family A protein [Trichocoleus sp.]